MSQSNNNFGDYVGSSTTGNFPIYTNSTNASGNLILDWNSFYKFVVDLDKPVILKFHGGEIELSPEDIKQALFKLFPEVMAIKILEK